MRNLITILAILLGLGASAQQTRLLTPDKYSDYGLVYALPNTAFEVEVTARHTVRQAGPFRQFAPKYVGTDNVITADAETWEITGVRLRTYGVANDSAIYRMQLKAGRLAMQLRASASSTSGVLVFLSSASRASTVASAVPMPGPQAMAWCSWCRRMSVMMALFWSGSNMAQGTAVWSGIMP